MEGEGAGDVPPLAEELLATEGCWEKDSPFPSGCVPGEAIRAPADDIPHPTYKRH